MKSTYLFLCLCLISVRVFASDAIVFYPGSASFWDQTFVVQAPEFSISPFPKSVDPRTVWVQADEVVSWRQLPVKLIVQFSDNQPIKTVRVTGFIEKLTSTFSYRAYYDEKNATLLLEPVLQITNKSAYEFKDIAILTRLEKATQSGGPILMAKSFRAEADTRTVDLGQDVYEYYLPKKTIQLGLTSFPLFRLNIANSVKKYRWQVGDSVEAIIQFKNTGQTPLAGGEVFLYTKEAFISRSDLAATAKDQSAELFYAKASDILAKKVIVSEKQDAQFRITEQVVTLSLQNSKTTPVEVEVIESLPYGPLEIAEASDVYKILDNRRIQFNIKLTPKSEKTIRLRFTAK